MYTGVRQNICAILLVKDLILIDPDDETELSSVLAFRYIASSISYIGCHWPQSFSYCKMATMSTKVKPALACRGRNVTYVRENVKLDVVFKEFMTSANHMLLVRREPDMPGGPDGDVTGLITLEDVMEELIGVRTAFCQHVLNAATVLMLKRIQYH